MKATEQFFPVVLFIMLYKVVLTFESVNEILKCDHSNESFLAVLSYRVQFVSENIPQCNLFFYWHFSVVLIREKKLHLTSCSC